MAVARALGLTGFVESLAGVVADGLQQPVADCAALLLSKDQRLVDQLGQQVEQPAATASAACVVQPPAKTDNRRSSARSGSDSSA